MKICSNCHNQVSDNYNYCIHCGSTNFEYANTNQYSTIVTENQSLNQSNIVVETKKCEYCLTEIEKNATVCPNCKRGLNWTTKRISLLWLTPVFIIIIIALYWYLSPDAPLKVRKFYCETGLRTDRKYCSYFVWEEEDFDFEDWWNS